jgi:hypothetical protein
MIAKLAHRSLEDFAGGNDGRRKASHRPRLALPFSHGLIGKLAAPVGSIGVEGHASLGCHVGTSEQHRNVDGFGLALLERPIRKEVAADVVQCL